MLANVFIRQNYTKQGRVLSPVLFAVGVSAEVHYNGAIMVYLAVTMVVVGPIISLFFTPIFYRLKSFSCYQVNLNHNELCISLYRVYTTTHLQCYFVGPFVF